jgi:hypothetical protein
MHVPFDRRESSSTLRVELPTYRDPELIRTMSTQTIAIRAPLIIVSVFKKIFKLYCRKVRKIDEISGYTTGPRSQESWAFFATYVI